MSAAKTAGVFAIATGIFALMPAPVDVEGFLISNQGLLDTFSDYIRCACYMLPMDTLVAIMTILIGLMVLRIVISFLKSLWGILPLV